MTTNAQGVFVNEDNKVSTLDELVAAYMLIRDPVHWCTGHFALDRYGCDTDPTCEEQEYKSVRFCALGALMHIHESAKTSNTLHCASMDSRFSASVAMLNDVYGHAAVLSVYEAAITQAAFGLMRYEP